ncbi:hypothetical protein ACQ4PT_004776 [Festuca glaucescens]
MRPKKKARGQGTSVDSGGLTALALRLADKLSNCEEHKDQNIMFSPLPIYTALVLVAAGARGTTLDEVLAVLGAASRDEVAGIMRAVAENALTGTDDPSGPLVVTSACGARKICRSSRPIGRPPSSPTRRKRGPSTSSERSACSSSSS